MNAPQAPCYYIKSIDDRLAMLESGTGRVVFWLKQRHVTFEMAQDDLAYVQATFYVVKPDTVEVTLNGDPTKEQTARMVEEARVEVSAMLSGKGNAT